MDKTRKILYFVMLALYALGAIGGIGYALYGRAYPVAVGVAATAWLAWPQVKTIYNRLTE